MMIEYLLIGMVIREYFANKDIIGFRGNENADSATKSALDLPRVKVRVLYMPG